MCICMNTNKITLKKMSLSKAMLAQKCPRCRKGNMFAHSMLHPFKFGTPNTTCSHCGLLFEVEPSFFTGAMYISYAINVAIMITLFVILNVFFTLDVYTLLGIVMGVMLAAVPFTYRYSRVLMMYGFSGVKYDENAGSNSNS